LRVQLFLKTQTPAYPAAALDAKVDGFVWATIQLDSYGAASPKNNHNGLASHCRLG
jgi:hypothetical protein